LDDLDDEDDEVEDDHVEDAFAGEYQNDYDDYGSEYDYGDDD